MNQPYDELDPEFVELFDALRPVPARDPESVAKGRAHFIEQVDDLYHAQPNAQPDNAGSKRSIYVTLKEKFTMKTRSGRTVFTAAVFAIIVLVILFGSAGMTAYAAQSALPGDALYSVKTGLEDTRLALSSSEATQARLNLRYAERRMQEVADLIAEGRYNAIADASQEYETHIQNALTNVQTLAKTDPALAAKIMAEITEALTRYTQVLTNISGSAPATVQPEMERLLEITQLRSQKQSDDQSQGSGESVELVGVVDEFGADYIIVNGQRINIVAATEMKDAVAVGALVKVHILTNPDGTLVAREIELANMDDNSNVNGNDNDDDQSNENSNSNTNSNSNDNDDDDSNGNDDDSNGNDDDSNGNDDDSNSNDDDSNGNDDDSNDNTNNDNGNDNSNDNGGDDDSNDNNGNEDY